MTNNPFENYQYNSCVSRGICSITPKNSALQTVLVLYLRLFAKYAINLDIKKKTQDFILNTISITIYNPEFNDNSYLFAINKFKEEFEEIIKLYEQKNNNKITEEERKRIENLFQETNDITQAIKFGEKAFNQAIEKIPNEIRDLYNIMLVVAKSISINLLYLESYEEAFTDAFYEILGLLTEINIETKDIFYLKEKINKVSKIDVDIMYFIQKKQEERYGVASEVEVSFSTIPNKAVLVVGSNIRELETILEALKKENIDIYTHDEMMLAHTLPYFSEYKNLKGQFGQGIESCLLDFATFPGPIILTKNSLHNIENFYRGRLFTTDYTTSPKGIIKIEDNDFSQVIASANIAKGFKKGKQCESIVTGINFKSSIEKIESKIKKNNYEYIFLIGLNNFDLELHAYFEKLIKNTPENVLIISFSHNSERENFIKFNTCFDNFTWFRVYEKIKDFEIPTTIFLPKCERSTISQMIYLSNIKNTKIYLGKCTPIILNPSLINTLEHAFAIKEISSVKKNINEILGDKS